MSALDLHAPIIGYEPSAAVLRDVALVIQPGEAVAVLGGNGAGKTALLHWIAGVLPRAGGRCHVAGRAVASLRQAVAAGLGLVTQDPDDQLLGTTLGDDVAIGPRNLGVSADDAARRVDDALARMGVGALRERAIESLSFGERKRAAVAGVLAMRPKLLLLDEPTAGLDPIAEIDLCATLRALALQGTTLLVTTHAVDLVPHFATRVVLLGEARVLADGPCRDVLVRDEALARARVRRPWPAELWARSCAATSTPGSLIPLTLEEVLRCSPRASS